jgi:tetratricopeptide (TPR) repeat protein
MVMALSWLGHVASAQGEPEAARGHLEAALAMAREQGDQLGISVALNGLAEFLRAEGDLDAAIPLYREGIAINRALSHTSNVANALLNLAAASTACGDLDAPQPLLREALALAQAIGSRAQGQFALDVIAGLALARGRWETGTRVFGASEAQLTQMGLQREPPDARFIAPLVAHARATLGEAAFDAAYAAGHALPYDAAVAEADAALRELSGLVTRRA